MTWLERILIFAGAPAMLVAFGSPAHPEGQESVAVARLQQQIASLEFRLDYETNRLQRTVEDMERRLQQAEQLRVLSPTIPTVPAPAPLRSVGAVGDEVIARRVVVTDLAGRARVSLAYSDLFGPTLALMTATGDVSAMLSLPEEGPRLELFDGAARLRVELALEAGTPMLRLLDVDGDVSASLPPASAFPPRGRW